MNNTPYVTALCPTFRHPDLLANSLELWLRQDYPLNRRMLVILDDDPTFHEQVGQSWKLHMRWNRVPTICDKYNQLISESPKETNIFMVWEDDDIYLPQYVRSHVESLSENNAEFSKSDVVLTDFPGKIIVEPSRGRFHSSLVMTKSLVDRVGGWPDTKRADFDQQLMSRLYSEAKGVVKPWPDDTPLEDIPFIYRWHSGSAHCQSTMDRGPEDETWYDRGEQAYAKVPFVGKLRPKMDDFTKKCFERFAPSYL